MKFSEAISSIWPRWRSSSRPSSAAISGSISASPAVFRCSNVSCATAIVAPCSGVMIVCVRRRRGAHRASASARDAAPSRRTRGSAPVKSITVDGVPGSGPASISAAQPSRIRSGTSSSVAGLGPAGLVRARRQRPRRPRRARAGPRRAGGDAHADRVGPSRRSASGSAAPGSASTSVYGPGSSARAIARAAAQLGHAARTARRGRREQRGRLRRAAALQRVEPLATAPRCARGGRARRPCRSAAARAARPGSPSTTAATSPSIAPPPLARLPARSGVIRSAPRSRRPRAARATSLAPSSCTSSTSHRLREQRAASRTSRSRLALVDERGARLPVAHLRLELVELGRVDVRRVRDDEVERAVDAVEQVGLDERRPSSPSRRRSRARARARRRETSVAVHARVRTLVRERERDRAGAGADVEHARLVDAGEQREAALDDDLGLGPRDERARVGLQRQPAEAPVAEHVGERLARGRAARTSVARVARSASVSGRSNCV